MILVRDILEDLRCAIASGSSTRHFSIARIIRANFVTTPASFGASSLMNSCRYRNLGSCQNLFPIGRSCHASHAARFSFAAILYGGGGPACQRSDWQGSLCPCATPQALLRLRDGLGLPPSAEDVA